MPFAFVPGSRTKYNVSDGAALDTVTYLPRLKVVLDNAAANGQAVELTLFDGVALLSNWGVGNPWFPGNSNNNMYDTCPASPDGLEANSPFPKFYNICNSGNGNTDFCLNSQLNCLGKIEKNYVRKLTAWIYSHHYRNVFFEIANEPKTNNLDVDQVRYDKWHATVAQWIKSGHGFLVSANVDPQTYDALLACCSGVTSDSSNCSLATCVEGGTGQDKCTAAQCSTENIYASFLLPGIDIVTFHHAWHDDGSGNVVTCATAAAAGRRFKRPVIIDDDGNPSARNTNCAGSGSDDVKTWAKDVKNCLGLGRVHFNHLDEMKHMPNDTTICALNPAEFPNKKLDCNALDVLADALPTQLCGKGYSCVCPSSGTIRYCFRPDTGFCSTSSSNIKCDNNVQTCNH
jgi:hypothetical protein